MHPKGANTESASAGSSSSHDTVQGNIPTGSPPHNPIPEAETTHSSTQVNNAKVSSSSKMARKNYIERFWSEEDEVRILKGILKFSKKFGDPFEDKTRLYRFVRKATHRSCSTTQVKDKIRRLKNRHKRVVYMAAKKRKDPEFLNDHDRIIYDLSNKIWKDNVLLASPKEKKRNGSDNDHSAPEKVTRSLLENLVSDFVKTQVIGKAFTISANKEMERKCDELLMMGIEHQIKRVDHYKSLLQMMASRLQGQNPSS